LGGREASGTLTTRLAPTGKRVLAPDRRCRAKDLRPRDPYWRAWRRFRRIRWEAALAFLVLAAAVILLAKLSWLFDPRTYSVHPGTPSGDAIVWVTHLAFGALVVVPSVYYGVARPSHWNCPRCGLPFFLSAEPSGRTGEGMPQLMPLWPLVQLCVNCGLPKWAPRDPDPTIIRPPERAL
jgi:hypothetical protein